MFSPWQKTKKNNLEKLLADPNDHRHGTTTGYDYGCRCLKCKAASSDYYRKKTGRAPRKKKLDWVEIKAAMRADPSNPNHGTIAGYVKYDCRCPRCLDTASKEYSRLKKIEEDKKNL